MSRGERYEGRQDNKGQGEVVGIFFFFKQKTAYEMCGRDWSSDVCSSDLKVQENPISSIFSPTD